MGGEQSPALRSSPQQGKGHCSGLGPQGSVLAPACAGCVALVQPHRLRVTCGRMTVPVHCLVPGKPQPVVSAVVHTMIPPGSWLLSWLLGSGVSRVLRICLLLLIQPANQKFLFCQPSLPWKPLTQNSFSSYSLSIQTRVGLALTICFTCEFGRVSLPTALPLSSPPGPIILVDS